MFKKEVGLVNPIERIGMAEKVLKVCLKLVFCERLALSTRNKPVLLFYGVAKFGKATDFESVMRRFKSYPRS